MEDLAQIIVNNFENRGTYVRYAQGNYFSTETWHMVIPITDSTFEIPVFALDAFERAPLIDTNSSDCMVSQVKNTSLKSIYKTLNSAIKEVLGTNLFTDKLILLPQKDGEPSYYGTRGALFDAQYTPVLMMTWEVSKFFDTESNRHRFKFVQPVLRVAPYIITNKDDSIQRFIINRIIPASLNYKVLAPNIHDNFKREDDNFLFPVKVIIDNFPFDMIKVSTPSISTTDKELRQVALDNIDELMQ